MADSAAAAASMKSSGKRGMIGGVVAAAIGIGISAATYESASIGGSYIFAWGPILFGLVTFFGGLMQYTKGANMARRLAASPAPAQPAYPPAYPAQPTYPQAPYPSQPVSQPAQYPAYPPAPPPPPPQWPTAQPSPTPPPPSWPASGGPPRTPPERAS